MGNQQPWHDKETLERLYHGDNQSLGEIGDKFDITKQSVVYWMDKHGIERRESYRDQQHASFHTRPDGYEVWPVAVDGVQHSVRVHRLLAAAEHGFEAVAGKHVHHESQIPWDNRPENLVILGVREHTNHHREELIEAKRQIDQTGVNNPKAKLSVGDVCEIRRKYGDVDVESLADKFDISVEHTRRVGRGDQWPDVDCQHS